MRYKVAEIEDQLIATLKADSTNFGGVLVDTHVGQVTPQMFLDPEYMQGFVKLLPFALISYMGRGSQRWDRDSSGKTYVHTITFRFFIGAENLRASKEGARNCYDMLAALFDDLHAKVPAITGTPLPGYTDLSGSVLTSSEATCLQPLYESGGTDELLILNMPGIVVYQCDFSLRMVA